MLLHGTNPARRTFIKWLDYISYVASIDRSNQLVHIYAKRLVTKNNSAFHITTENLGRTRAIVVIKNVVICLLFQRL